MLWGSLFAVSVSLAGLTLFGSIRVVGDLLALAFALSLFTVICATEAASEGGFHGCHGQNVLLKFRSASVRVRRGCSA